MSKEAMNIEDLKSSAVLLQKGNFYDDFADDQVFEHHWGRTLNSGDNSLFSTLTLHYNPAYTNLEHAKSLGHDRVVVNPLLVFNTVLGLSVEDLSEVGGPFLGIKDCNFHRPFYEGDTITAKSTVIERRMSNREGAGIITWHTEGFNQDGELVIDYIRTNFVIQKGADFTF